MPDSYSAWNAKSDRSHSSPITINSSLLKQFASKNAQRLESSYFNRYSTSEPQEESPITPFGKEIQDAVQAAVKSSAVSKPPKSSVTSDEKPVSPSLKTVAKKKPEPTKEASAPKPAKPEKTPAGNANAKPAPSQKAVGKEPPASDALRESASPESDAGNNAITSAAAPVSPKSKTDSHPSSAEQPLLFDIADPSELPLQSPRKSGEERPLSSLSSGHAEKKALSKLKEPEATIEKPDTDEPESAEEELSLLKKRRRNPDPAPSGSCSPRSRCSTRSPRWASTVIQTSRRKRQKRKLLITAR
ncbi:MAG: hypothetical protein I3J00_04850 [Mesosutterella multiformis]|nr:hypothetical protein [Mesosutterella multiformis]